MRDHTLYFGETAAIFTPLSEFEYTPGQNAELRLVFDTWRSIASFDAGDPPIERLRKEFHVEHAFLQANAAVFSAIADQVLSILDVAGRNYNLVRCKVNIRAKQMNLEAVDPTKNIHAWTDVTEPEKFDALVEANQQLIGAVEQVSWTYAKGNDDLLQAMTAA